MKTKFELCISKPFEVSMLLQQTLYLLIQKLKLLLGLEELTCECVKLKEDCIANMLGYRTGHKRKSNDNKKPLKDLKASDP